MISANGIVIWAKGKAEKGNFVDRVKEAQVYI